MLDRDDATQSGLHLRSPARIDQGLGRAVTPERPAALGSVAGHPEAELLGPSNRQRQRLCPSAAWAVEEGTVPGRRSLFWIRAPDSEPLGEFGDVSHRLAEVVQVARDEVRRPSAPDEPGLIPEVSRPVPGERSRGLRRSRPIISRDHGQPDDRDARSALLRLQPSESRTGSRDATRSDGREQEDRSRLVLLPVEPSSQRGIALLDVHQDRPGRSCFRLGSSTSNEDKGSEKESETASRNEIVERGRVRHRRRSPGFTRPGCPPRYGVRGPGRPPRTVRTTSSRLHHLPSTRSAAAADSSSAGSRPHPIGLRTRARRRGRRSSRRPPRARRPGRRGRRSCRGRGTPSLRGAGPPG
jgi:hypothetical protein